MAQHFPSRKKSKLNKIKRELGERRERSRNSRNRAKARRSRRKESKAQISEEAKQRHAARLARASEARKAEKAERKQNKRKSSVAARSSGAIRKSSETRGYVPRRLRKKEAPGISAKRVENAPGYYVPLEGEVSDNLRNRYSVITGIGLAFLLFIGVATFFDSFEGESAVYERAYNDNVFDYIAGQIDSFTAEYDDNIYSQNSFIDCYGLVERLAGRTYIPDTDVTLTVVRNSLNQLQFVMPEMDEETIESNGTNANRLKIFLDQREIPLLYVSSPVKNTPGRTELPVNVYDYSNQNSDNMLSELQERGIDTIDLRENMLEDGLKSEDLFFKTDHHWTANAGIWSADIIMQKLATMYPEHFKYDASLFDKDNYNIEVLENFFLGRQGERVGQYFGGRDDYPIYSPKFDTNFSVLRYNRDGTTEGVKTGTFDEAVVCPEYLTNITNGHSTDAYSYYTGADLPIVQITNNDPDATGRILIVKDSFARMTVPFLATGVKEICMIDMRYYKGNLYDYIESYSPDLVMLHYNSDYYSSDSSAFNFSKNIKY